MISITIKYGTGNTLTRSFATPITVGELRKDKSIQAALGFGENTVGWMNSVEQPDSINLADGDVVSIHDKACSKAGRNAGI